MRQAGKLGFRLGISSVRNNILIPKYYDPEIETALEGLAEKFEVVSLAQLVERGHLVHTHGDYVPKIHYGTGPFPYVRTSDLANYEVKASPKHGVPRHVYDDYASDQSVRPGDIFFVHEGTYLVGTVAMVTDHDGPMLYQHHLAKFTVKDGAPFGAHFLLVAFESPLVRRQVRAKQFSADIIDSVVGRLPEVRIAYPRDCSVLESVDRAAREAIDGRAVLRQQISDNCVSLDGWLSADDDRPVDLVLATPKLHERKTAFLGGRRGFTATVVDSSSIKGNVLLPRYYDPVVEAQLAAYSARCDLVSVRELVDQTAISVGTGDEIGRMSYGTGAIPFVRTSDLASWELKRDAKQGVSAQVHREWAQDVRPDDILLVRDGTYLVGSSVLVTEDDLPLLFCGGINRIRSLDSDRVPAGLLFALLNTPFVRRQLRNKQFTRDVIDTIGQRLMEIVLPIPRDRAARDAISRCFRDSIRERVRLRSVLHHLSLDLYS